mmetsp:Transcript_95995/g.298918  ORF Transcript_95995/g.298918 Transcript_95995/m.298918 type:complete len:229 (-) Transcript_95995:1120-1806(-)
MGPVKDAIVQEGGILQDDELAHAAQVPEAGLRHRPPQVLRQMHRGGHRVQHPPHEPEDLPGADELVQRPAEEHEHLLRLRLPDRGPAEDLRAPHGLLQGQLERVRLRLRVRRRDQPGREDLLRRGLDRGVGRRAHLQDSEALPHHPVLQGDQQDLHGAHLVTPQAGERHGDLAPGPDALRHLGGEPLLHGQEAGRRRAQRPRQLRRLLEGVHHALPGDDGRGVERAHA